MLFISLKFLVFLACVYFTFSLTPHRFRWMVLLAASYIFYGLWEWWYLPLLIVPTLVVYLCARRITSTDKKKGFLVLGLGAALAGLLVFKYTNFLVETVVSVINRFFSELTYQPLKLILPVGISFFTFKLVSYLIDVYRGNIPPEKHLGYFSLYVSFFPQIFMGPIDRAGDFISKLKQRTRFDPARLASAGELFTWGLFKKVVIADRFGLFVDTVFSNPNDQGWNLLFAAYFYAFQIYCDFSGYTDMAIAVSRLFGYESMKNFDYPYFSRSITQFWNRWHISLSTWLRDYLFLPIAYATMRKIPAAGYLGLKVEAVGYVTGMSVTMFLGGLWHGARWTFVVWGMIHGFFLIGSYVSKRSRKRLAKRTGLARIPGLHRFLQIFITFHMVTFAWIFFRSPTFQGAVQYIGAIRLTPVIQGAGQVVFNSLWVLIFLLLEFLRKNRFPRFATRRGNVVFRLAAYALLVCVIIIFSVDTTNEFIYFQF